MARNRSGSIQLEEIRGLLSEMQKDLSSQLTDVLSKLEKLEKSVESIQANQVRLDNEISHIKEVIIGQQEYIEKMEAEKRKNNLIVHGVPESSVTVGDDDLETDAEKIVHLMYVVDPDASPSIESITRIGRKETGKPRNLLVKFKCQGDRNRFLYGQEKLSR